MSRISLNNAVHPEPEGEHEMEQHPVPSHGAERAPFPPPPHHHPPIPHHERGIEFRVEVDENDVEILKAIFHDDDTVSAAVKIINDAPPEIQILTVQIIKMIEEETKHES